ncbi:hypothetical protein [Bacillus sp. B1-b2]|nr:hypothetical protein [Bacillus sp. B1-b2]
MTKQKKSEVNNQWAGTNNEVTSKKQNKTATDNQWTSANKKS